MTVTVSLRPFDLAAPSLAAERHSTSITCITRNARITSACNNADILSPRLCSPLRRVGCRLATSESSVANAVGPAGNAGIAGNFGNSGNSGNVSNTENTCNMRKTGNTGSYPYAEAPGRQRYCNDYPQ